MIFIALALVGGKFKLAGKASIVEKQAWNKFLIPNVKTERLRYFNNITRGVYESAYFGKQTGFQAYLDGQRRFRYGIKLKCDALQNIYSSYQEGLIPKQNICWKRCNDFPSDVKVDDASKSQCAVEHFNGTISSLKSLKDQLLSRKKELYNEHMEEKSWAGDEIKFICESIFQIEEMMNGIEKIMHDVQHVMHQLEKRFDAADVRKTEKRRRARRDKETRTKLKKKKRIVQERHEAQVAEQVECASFSSDEEDALVNIDID